MSDRTGAASWHTRQQTDWKPEWTGRSSPSRAETIDGPDERLRHRPMMASDWLAREMGQQQLSKARLNARGGTQVKDKTERIRVRLMIEATGDKAKAALEAIRALPGVKVTRVKTAAEED